MFAIQFRAKYICYFVFCVTILSERRNSPIEYIESDACNVKNTEVPSYAELHTYTRNDGDQHRVLFEFRAL